MKRCANGGLMLAHRLRRWPDNKPPLAQRLVFAGVLLHKHPRPPLPSHHPINLPNFLITQPVCSNHRAATD